MTDDLGTIEYQSAMHRIVLAAQCIEDEPFDKMRATIERCHSVGGILYPSEYRDALYSGSLDAQQRMIIAAQEFVRTLADVKEMCA